MSSAEPFQSVLSRVTLARICHLPVGTDRNSKLPSRSDCTCASAMPYPVWDAKSNPTPPMGVPPVSVTAPRTRYTGAERSLISYPVRSAPCRTRIVSAPSMSTEFGKLVGTQLQRLPSGAFQVTATIYLNAARAAFRPAPVWHAGDKTQVGDTRKRTSLLNLLS
jgi:hypothetical protein